MRISPPLYSSLPPTIRAILQASKNASASTSTAAVAQSPSKLPPQAFESSKLLYSASLESAGGETVVRGWVKSKRGHKNVSFAAINDGSGANVQAVWKGNNGVVDR
jgi:aspartyl-tRNA synthetase